MSTSSPVKARTFFGHPFGLTTLFFTEMWERASFYGMRALLIYYMEAKISDPNSGLQFTHDKASSIYGAYMSSVYLTPIVGGWLADKFLGARRSVLIGGIIIACGHFCMLLNTVPTFFLGLVLIVCGTGLLKPNVSTMVGDLYDEKDERRDAGFSIFYMGINLGALVAPIICGYLGQKIAWHYGFAAAGFGMVLGIIQYVLGGKYLGTAGLPKEKKSKEISAEPKAALTVSEKKRLIVIGILFVFSVLFWMAFEQQGNTLNLFAKDLTNNSFLGHPFPSSWFQSVESIFVVALAPVLAWIWARMADKQPSSAAKFAIGLFLLSLGYVVMTGASKFIGAGLVSPLWLISAYGLMGVGELCLSPIGLSTVTKLSPPRYVGAMMGLWFVTLSIGEFLAGQVGRLYDATNPSQLIYLFGGLAVEALIAAIVLYLLTPFIKRTMLKAGAAA